MCLRKYISRTLLLISVLFGLNAMASSENTYGYVVTLNSDTIYGVIQLSHFDQVTGGLILNGIEEESFHSRVVFIAKNEKRFKTYFPEMLLGFGFTYRSVNYVYQRVLEQRKSIFKSDMQQYRFLRLVYQDEGGVRYKDVRMAPNPGLQSNEDEYMKFNTHLFRIKKENGLKIEKRDTIRNL
jgi:hypothetical protein